MLISIVMPAYCAEKYLAEAIESVLAQTYQEWELIIIDDNSCDNTEKIAEEFVRRDTRLRYMRNSKQLGAGGSRNKGIRKAAGEWIAFLDSDDQWRKDKLEKQADVMLKANASFVFSGSDFVDEEGRDINYYLSVPDKIGYRKLLRQNIISCSSVVIKKELLLKYPMQGNWLHEDYVVWLQILKNQVEYAFGINEPLLIYRVVKSSKSGDKKNAARMTWRVYRHIELPFAVSMYYWCCYAVRNLIKYFQIWKSALKNK